MSIIKNLVNDDAEVWVKTPIDPDFQVKLKFASKDKMAKIQKESIKQHLDRQTRQVVTETDDEKFLEKFLTYCVKDWTGLTKRVLAEMIPMDLEEFSEEELAEEIPYDVSEAVDLIHADVTGFDEWLIMSVRDLENFTKRK